MLMDANEMANCGCGAARRVSLARPRCSSFITATPLESSRWGDGVIRTINIKKTKQKNKTMKDYYYAREAWFPASLPCGAHSASSEVTFLCPAELAAELFPGRSCEMEMELAVGWPPAIFHLRNSLACQSQQRQPLMPAKAG